MANHKSAKKRARQTPVKTARNTIVKKTMRTIEKKLRLAIDAKDKKAATELMNTFMSKTAKAAQKNVLHAKSASRKIGRLASKVSGL